MSNNIEAPREPKDLFNEGRMGRGETSRSSEIETRVLPLGAFSEFILAEQPRILAKIRAGNLDVEELIKRQRELLTKLNLEDVEIAARDPILANIAMLDLTFALNAAILAKNPPSGNKPPDALEQLSDHFAQATGLPRIMTFEKIVGINSKLPYKQMRTFTDGEVGETERMFYYAHELMNTDYQDTAGVASDAVATLTTFGRQGVREIEAPLARAIENMNKFSDFMAGFMRMPVEHFAIFRQYLSQYPDGNRNASAAFMGMPRLNLRLMGSASFYEDFLNEGMQYFPVTEQQDIQQARIDAQQGDYLVAICERLEGQEGKNLAGKVEELIEPLHQFRLTHFAAVLKYLPPQAIPEGGKNLRAQLEEPYESILEDQPGVIRGTGGFLPGPLLRNMLRLDLRSLERLRTVVDGGDS